MYAIVRSMKSQSNWIQQLPELSPSPQLFRSYLNLKQANMWSRSAFETTYVPTFLHEMRHSQAAANALNMIAALDNQGKNIALVCFCPDETLCHRSIIAGLFQGAGHAVATDTGRNYSHYYQAYLNA